MAVIYEEYSRIREIVEWTEKQIEISNKERQFWFKNFSTMSVKYPALVSMAHVDRLGENIEQLHETRDFYAGIKSEVEQAIESKSGLEHQVAYKRFVERKTLAEIAEELNFSPEYIRRVSARVQKEISGKVVIKGYKQATEQA